MKLIKRNQTLTPYSQSLRKNMTAQERHLWYDFLKQLPISVHRQHIVGPYIADFYIASPKIVIELDGGGHYMPDQMEYDKKRNAYMEANGITVLRYTNLEVNNHFSAVCEDIMQKLGL